ncbi:hypothetical protein ACQ4PT_064359 [Festuca glaucescens]
MEDAGINGSDPFFCTQADQTEVVDESQDPLLAEHGGQGGDSDVHSGGGQQFNAAPPPANPSTENINTTTMPTTSLSGSSNPELADHGADGVAPNEEVASSPQEPFLGMRFDTIEDAREHYNAYSKRLGFSIKSNTSLRQPFTKVVRKQQFVCNKYRAPKTEEQIQEERVKFVEEPTNIITDQDQAMRNAIKEVFFDTVHRNCRWHVMKKANEKLGPFLGRHPGLAEDFNECINESMSEDEFEARWAEMIAKWELGEHETFLWLKKYAKFWVPCYYRHRFFPFLQSTQRSEGFNVVLKRYINPHNSIKHFGKQYEKLQQRILGKEGHNDFRTDELEPDRS